MWQLIRSRILTVIICIGAAHGLLFVGPKFIRDNQSYTLTISNFYSNPRKMYLMVKLEGQTDNGLSVLNITKMIDVRSNSIRMISFSMPDNLSTGDYKITIDGQQGFNFHMETDLFYLKKSVAGLIQVDKPVFKPGDTVNFRVIVLDTELKPPAKVKTVHVTIRDPQRNVIRKWSTAKLYTGVFEGDLQIAPTPMLGVWNILVQVEGEELVSKTFEVKEYVLSMFDVQVMPSVIPLKKHQALNLTIEAYYHFGKPVQGVAKVELYLDDDKLDQQKEITVYGIGQVELRFADYFDMYEDQQDVRVKVTFIEHYTNRTVVKQSQITVYRYAYRVQLIKESPQFRPGFPFKCALQFTHHDGTPAKGITGKVEVTDVEFETTATSDHDGFIKLELHPSEGTEYLGVNFDSIDGFYYYEEVSQIETDAFIKLELKSPINLNKLMRFIVTCTERMTFFVYYVVSKSNIVDAGFVRPKNETTFLLQLYATEKLFPKAKMLVATVTGRTVVYDYINLDFQVFHNNFTLSVDEQEIKPGRQIELSMSGRPGAYVGLAAYDKALLLFNQNHDLILDDFLKVFDGFHVHHEGEFDQLHTMGLFARTLDDFLFQNYNHKSERNGQHMEQTVVRKQFVESWLWKNATIGSSGSLKLTEVVPDTTTSWYLTAFSIDPVVGLGIIKKPIEFTTVQPFVIMESLPYSIKRGEAIEIKFILISSLQEEHTVDVTLYNENNEMEFIGRSIANASYTKSVRVLPKVGKPISFLVKAKKLGEMMVRVKASIANGIAADALEKVIQVTPESLVQSGVESFGFFMNTYQNRTFLVNPNIDKKADNGSVEIKLRFNPNLLITVKDNLNDIRTDWSRCNEGIRGTLNFVVHDYLNTIGSSDQISSGDSAKIIIHFVRLQKCFISKAPWRNKVFDTAFLVNALHNAMKYVYWNDKHKLEKIFAWLASQQHHSGSFKETESDLHYKRSEVALTSYVLAVMLENESAKVEHAVVIEKGMSFLSNQLDLITSANDLAIVTYAMMLYGHRLRDAAFEKLIDMSTITNNGTERYWNTSNSVEATSFALLSYVVPNKLLEALPIMRWLVNQKSELNSVSGQQNTYLRLKALSSIAKKISPSRNDLVAKLKYKQSTRLLRLNSYSNMIQSLTIPQDVRKIEITVMGIGAGLLQVFYRYNLNLMNFEHRFQLDVQKQNTSSNHELRLKVCASFIPTVSESRSNMALFEVTLPSGYEVDHNPISEQTTVNPIYHIEIRYGGTSVVVYYKNMSNIRNCFTVSAYRRLKVALKRPAYVVVYDYYDTNLNAIKVYEVDKQNVCEICEEENCPAECKI
ncbi:thioester-containing protein 1 allele S3-like [Anopheles gambiae]|uniref:thioester-containing protein 1 allele S3-like n=1 Tax=Anopheles gambiae TaxID=7165 RepID=UPI002AC8F542|nr:thioester-containing protein 1 allele S3-like [Anopheles gambiae]